jgi:eukaryotic-like serine/threonine-protein kinase
VESPRPGDRVQRHGRVDLRLSSGPVTHVLPPLQDKAVGAARTILGSLDVSIATTKHAFSSTVKKGEVIDTVPASGTTVDAGSAVTLIVSRGVQKIPVPNVVGMKKPDAIAALHHLGFVVSPTRDYSSTVAMGDVISSTPAAKSVVPKGATVALVISRGPHTVEVPNVVGESIADAVKAIRAAGLNPDPRQVLPGGPGQVLQEMPTGQQPLGTTITLSYF